MRVVKFDGLYEAVSVDLIVSPDDRKVLIDVQAADGCRAGIELSFDVAAALKAQLDAVAAEHPTISSGRSSTTSTH